MKIFSRARIHYFILCVLMLPLGLLLVNPLPSSAQQSQLSARTVVNRTRAYMLHAGGIRLHFHCKALGLYNYSGDMLIKDNKSMLISERHTVWNNGQVAWALDKAKNTVTIRNPKNEQNNRIADQLAIVDNCDLTIASAGNNWRITLKPRTRMGFFNRGEVLIDKKTYYPTQLRLRYLTIWITVNISNFSLQDYPDALFTFDRKKYPTAKIIDKR